MHFNQLSQLDFDMIKNLYETEAAALMEQLNQGKTWEQMSELRATLSALSALIYDKVQGSDCQEMIKG